MSLWLASTITRLEEHSNRIAVAVRRASRREKPAQARLALWQFLDRWLALAIAAGVELPLRLDEPTIRAAVEALRTRIEQVLHLALIQQRAGLLPEFAGRRDERVAAVRLLTRAAQQVQLGDERSSSKLRNRSIQYETLFSRQPIQLHPISVMF